MSDRAFYRQQAVKFADLASKTGVETHGLVAVTYALLSLAPDDAIEEHPVAWGHDG